MHSSAAAEGTLDERPRIVIFTPETTGLFHMKNYLGKRPPIHCKIALIWQVHILYRVRKLITHKIHLIFFNDYGKILSLD